MKAKILCLFLSLVMIASLATAMAVCVHADDDNLQICTDVVEINGVGYESTSQLSANRWFEQEYNGLIEDKDGSVNTFRIRGWVNPLDGSKTLQYGYSICGTIIWDDAFMAPNEGLKGYFANAERYDLTINFGHLDVGTYEFHMYVRTSSGVYEMEEKRFTFVKKASAGYENVALNKTVYADMSMECSFFGAAMLTDGVVPAFETTDDPLGWTCLVGDPMLQARDQEIYIYIDLGDKYEVGRVNVVPQRFLDGNGFPSSFTILTGLDKDNMTAVVSAKNINETAEDATIEPTVLTFAPVEARYVAIRIDRASWLQEQDGSYLSEIGEMEVYGKLAAKATHTVTFKNGDTVVATVTYEEGATSINVPDVPAKDGYTGVWAEFKLENKDIEVNAIYTEVTQAETKPVTEPATEPATEADTVAATEADTEAATVNETEAATEAATGAVNTDTIGDDTAGCTSVVSASAVVLFLLCGAVVLNKRKE